MICHAKNDHDIPAALCRLQQRFGGCPGCDLGEHVEEAPGYDLGGIKRREAFKNEMRQSWRHNAHTRAKTEE